MRKLLVFCLFFVAIGSLWGQKFKLPKLDLNLDSPIVQGLMKRTLQEFIPRVTGKDGKVKDIRLDTRKALGETIKLKGTVIFENPKAMLGNGNYRFKMRLNSDLLKPKIHYLKLQVSRIWFIRFYRRVI